MARFRIGCSERCALPFLPGLEVAAVGEKITEQDFVAAALQVRVVRPCERRSVASKRRAWSAHPRAAGWWCGV